MRVCISANARTPLRLSTAYPPLCFSRPAGTLDSVSLSPPHMHFTVPLPAHESAYVCVCVCARARARACACTRGPLRYLLVCFRPYEGCLLQKLLGFVLFCLIVSACVIVCQAEPHRMCSRRTPPLPPPHRNPHTDTRTRMQNRAHLHTALGLCDGQVRLGVCCVPLQVGRVFNFLHLQFGLVANEL